MNVDSKDVSTIAGGAAAMLDPIRSLMWYAIAGISGAFTSLSLHKEKRTPFEVVVFIISGCLTAAFVSPLIAKWLNITGYEGVSALSFLVGACWNTVIGNATQWFKSIKFGGSTNVQ